LPPVRGERSPAEDGLSRVQPAPPDTPILFVGRRYAPVHRMDHYEIGEGRRSDRISRRVLVCACGVSFSIGAPLPDCAWLAVLRWHAVKFLANIGREKYFQVSGVNGVFAGLWAGKAIFLATPIHLATRNQGKTIENGFHACGTTFWRPLSHNSDLN